MRVLIILSALFCVGTCISIQAPLKGVYVGWEDINWGNVTGSIMEDPVAAGFNYVILNFFAQYDKQGFDALEAWKLVDPATRQATVAWAHSQGAAVIGGVKLSGQYGDPYSQNATQLGETFGGWALQYNLDGLDINFQDINQGFQVNNGINLTMWALELLSTIRSTIGPDLLLSIAASPVSFGPAGDPNTYAGVSGGLLGVYKAMPNDINYIFLWYFLQSSDCLASYQVFFVDTTGTQCSPLTAVTQELNAGSPINKTIVAVAVQVGDVPGYLPPATFGSYIRTANATTGWNAGVATWNWQGLSFTSSWLTTVYTVPNVTTTGTTTTGSTTTTTTGSTNTTTTTGSTNSTTTTGSTNSSTTTGVATTGAATTGNATTTGAVTTTTAPTTAKSTTTTTTGAKGTTSGSSTSNANHAASVMGWVAGIVIALSVMMC